MISLWYESPQWLGEVTVRMLIAAVEDGPDLGQNAGMPRHKLLERSQIRMLASKVLDMPQASTV